MERKYALLLLIITFPCVAGVISVILLMDTNVPGIFEIPFARFYIVTGILFVLQNKYRWFRIGLITVASLYTLYQVFVTPPPVDVNNLLYVLTKPSAFPFYGVMIIILLLIRVYRRRYIW
jgi:hypothetical protein